MNDRSIDGLPVKVFECSVDPQKTVLGSATGVVFAIHIVAPEDVNPAYAGALRGVYPNHVAFDEYGKGQKTSRQTAVVQSLDDEPKWDRGRDTAGNRRDITPGCYVLCRLTRQPHAGKDGAPDTTTMVKLYRER